MTHVATPPFEFRSADDVRALIASSLLLRAGEIPGRVGSITLRPRQRTAAERIVCLINEYGGALLADPVGSGKTYTALAIASAFGGAAAIIAPASLRATWRDALDATGIVAPVISHESLSRGVAPALLDGMIIVDEAHRFRSPLAKRYELLASIANRRRTLLVSATPIQNRRADLSSQLALFLGRRAWSMRDEELAAFVVRDRADGDPGSCDVPELNGPLPVTLETHDDCLEQLLALPPPIVARDESVAAALLSYSLVHQWTSSRAAMVAALRRRRTKGLALLAAMDAGRYPTRSELSAWTHLDDAVQLAFPELVTDARPMEGDLSALAVQIDRHLAAIEALLSHCRRPRDPDDERALLLRRLIEVHPGERIIAFCHYAETVDALRRRLANVRGVAALTAHGARVASGRVSRDTLLEQFTPRHPGLAHPSDVDPSKRIDLLITTDLLSEGLNLQEASVVVHLDLPWNPARLDQRVGRVRRLGSRHRVVTVYAVAPPAPAERMLRIEERLRHKLRVAQRSVGVAGRILPALLTNELSDDPRGLAERSGAIDRTLRGWLATASAGASAASDIIIVGAASSDLCGFIAAIRDDGVRLIADIGDGIATDARTLDLALSASGGSRCPVGVEVVSRTLDRIGTHLRSTRASGAIDFAAAANARARRAALARVAQTVARTPRHRRSLIASLADSARAVATAPLGEGAERVLDLLVRAELPDEAWLRSIVAFGELNAPRSLRDASGTAPAIVAVLILVPAMR